MYSDEGTAMDEIGNSSGGNLAACERDTISEPCEGMEFDSEEAAKVYYDNYARSVGFVMRVMSCYRSERDGKIIARRLGCNKEGYSVNRVDDSNLLRKNREGCKAMVNLKYRSGKWVVAKFVREHSHPLVVSPCLVGHSTDEKDRKIQELTTELRNKRRLCAAYKEQLTSFLKIIEDHNDQISMKVQNVANNLKEYESIGHELQSSKNHPL